MLSTLWQAIQAILQMLSSIFDVIRQMGAGAITLARTLAGAVTQINTSIAPMFLVMFGALGTLILGGAVAVIIGSVWEAIN